MKKVFLSAIVALAASAGAGIAFADGSDSKDIKLKVVQGGECKLSNWQYGEGDTYDLISKEEDIKFGDSWCNAAHTVTLSSKYTGLALLNDDGSEKKVDPATSDPFDSRYHYTAELINWRVGNSGNSGESGEKFMLDTSDSKSVTLELDSAVRNNPKGGNGDAEKWDDDNPLSLAVNVKSAGILLAGRYEDILTISLSLKE